MQMVCRAGFLKPQFSIEGILQGSQDFRPLRSYVRWYFVKVVAFFAVVAAAVSGVAWKALSLLPM